MAVKVRWKAHRKDFQETRILEVCCNLTLQIKRANSMNSLLQLSYVIKIGEKKLKT